MLLKKKIKHYIIFLLMFFSWAGVANANLEITEVMYNLDGADIDWIEIYNPDSSDVDVTEIKLLISNNTFNHDIKGYSGSQYLHKGELGVIVVGSQISSFLSRWSNSAILFTSSFSLPNLKDGEEATVSINNGDKNSPLDSVTYKISDGGNGNGNSLSGDLEELTPTPGKANSSNSVSSNNYSEDITIDENIDLIPIIEEKAEILKITTKIISPKIIVAGIPFSISSLTTTNRGNTYAVGRFVWNFGDGRISEVKVPGPFEYTYEYPGEYSMTLSYFDNNFTKQPDATNRIIIKVIPAEIFISSVGDIINSFIELENKSNYEITLSNWIITAGFHYFVIPEGTTLLSGKKIKLSPKITGFTGDDIKSVSIMNTNKELIATYPIEIKIPIQKNLPLKKTTNNKTNNYNNKNEDSLLRDPDVINLNELAASAAGPNVDVSKSTYAFIGLVLIIGIGIASFLLIKRKEKISDYMENDIRPEDMKIIE
ncbi:MAG: lamin tail domain-containing protein [Candidatus Pacebacteria bacterium]|nr:lamin tail domain-containing protein [Candidatus Paceibacterota bacterium]